MCVMRTYKTGVAGKIFTGVCTLFLLAGFAIQSEVAAKQGDTAGKDGKLSFASVGAAYQNGLGLFRAGRIDLALPALEFAAKHENLSAKLWLARIYSGAVRGLPVRQQSNLKAFNYYQHIAERLREVKHYDRAAPIAAEAFIALAEYYKNGLSEAGIKPNSEEAVRLYRHAVYNFQNPVAEYLFAKAIINGDGIAKDAKKGSVWLLRSAKKNYAPAQAVLGKMFWDGANVRKNRAQGLALLKLAVRNMNDGSMEWIRNQHGRLLAAADPQVRMQSDMLVESWERRFGTGQKQKGSMLVINSKPPVKYQKTAPTGFASNDKGIGYIRIEPVHGGMSGSGKPLVSPANETRGGSNFIKLNPVPVPER